MTRDINPNELKNEKRVKGITLLEVFEDYLKTRKSLKPNTLNDNRKCMLTHFSDWQKKAILDITKDMVSKKYAEPGKKNEAQANLAMRFLRAIFNFAAAQYGDNRRQPETTGDNRRQPETTADSRKLGQTTFANPCMVSRRTSPNPHQAT